MNPLPFIIGAYAAAVLVLVVLGFAPLAARGRIERKIRQYHARKNSQKRPS